MSIDYDKIQQGRRRDWKELLPPDERARRRKEEEAKNPEKQRSKSWLRRRDELMEEQREQDKVEWQHAKRKVQRLLIISLIVVAALMAASITWMRVAKQRMTDKFDTLEALVMRGQTYQVYEDPVDAWASWRSAMLRRDGKSLARVESPSRLERNRGQRDLSAYVAQLDSLLKRNRMTTERYVASAFKKPIIETMPDTPWGDGELAVMVSEPLVPPGARRDAKKSAWVAVFSYHRKAREWRFEDLREQKNWDKSWRFASQIRSVIEMERKAARKLADDTALDP